MKAPGFWYRAPGREAAVLTPLGWLYDLGGRLRRLRTLPLDPGPPVICVGNLVAGGAGKTPVALALATLLLDRGITPHLLTRGYGGRLKGPVRVAPGRHDADDVGDEPLLLAEAAPTWVARDRAAGALAAAAAGAQAIVLDDGFQNPALGYRLALVVVDGSVGFGNGRMIPAGPLREPVARGLGRASALVMVGCDRTELETELVRRTAVTGHALPLFQARLTPDPGVAASLRGQRLLAFAGIGRPEKFFETCRALDAELVGTAPFPDHHRYRPADVATLLARARALNAVPVTTAKDGVRLPDAIRREVRVLPVTLTWRDPEAMAKLLQTAILSPAPGAFTPGSHQRPEALGPHV